MAVRVHHPGAESYVPDGASLDELAAAAQQCRGCDLFANATQAVFGEGARQARWLLVGEQPGDAEDHEGEPFVGPAGRVLDEALASAGLVREEIYLTNAVKHFRWRPAPRGKRRIHQTPTRGQTVACRPWLMAEILAVQPDVVVTLGATALGSLLGPSARLGASRGRRLDWQGRAAVATIHPSAVLRAPDADARAEAYQGLVDDLRLAADLGLGD
jgi:DNA polymerase